MIRSWSTKRPLFQPVSQFSGYSTHEHYRGISTACVIDTCLSTEPPARSETEGHPPLSLPLFGPAPKQRLNPLPVLPNTTQAIVRVRNAGDDDAPLEGGGLNSVGPFEVRAVCHGWC